MTRDSLLAVERRLAILERLLSAAELTQTANHEFWDAIGVPFPLCPNAEPTERDECRRLLLLAIKGSIDAALALVSRCLPGAEFEISTLYGPAHVTLPLNGDECADARREDGNVPLAICLALCRALLAKEQTE